MPPALDALEIVALGGLDVAQTGAAAHDVDDHGGDAGACAVGDALLLQGHTGAGRRGDDAGAGTGSAVHHVDRATSLSACRKQPPISGIRADMYSGISVCGVMG